MKIISFFKNSFYLILEYILIFKLYFLELLNRNAPIKWNTGERGVVVLIPGFTEGLEHVRYLGNRLNEQGFRIIIPAISTKTKRIEDSAKEVLAELDDLGITKPILIGHSKGALISCFIEKIKPGFSSKIVTISSPIKGSIWGHFRIMNLSEMIPNSKLLKYIQEIANEKISLNIYPKVDNHVIPKSSLVLGKEDIDVEVDIVGHTRILFDDRVIILILCELNNKDK
ncbi:MAG: hypothetical protein Q9M91_02135 [Candidatus Dojkabacteria bacterium]|nr:hypothetical protein [Candidatus Dojkabacteria bacterium]MDQ7020623.1 hypothetical protein [Candidatus Dojkabacteria bacterium]